MLVTSVTGTPPWRTLYRRSSAALPGTKYGDASSTWSRAPPMACVRCEITVVGSRPDAASPLTFSGLSATTRTAPRSIFSGGRAMSRLSGP